MLLTKDKIFELHNSDILSSLKTMSYEKLVMTSQFDLTPFSNSRIPDLSQYPFFLHRHKSFQMLETQNQKANVANILSITALVASDFFS